MKDLMMKVTITQNPELQDDEVVSECMDKLMNLYPQIRGYMFERVTKDHINILMWGDL